MATPTAILEAKIPDHVPPDLILPFDPWSDMRDRPHEALERVRPYGPIVYSPRHHIIGFAPNGSWMVTSAKTARALLLDTVNFSSRNTTGIPQALGESFKLAPIEADPPEHSKTRAVLNPLFSPSAMKALEGKIRERSIGLIDAILEKGECDFVRDFAKVLPSEIFLDMMGLPHSRLPEFLAWEEMIMGATDFAGRLKGLQSVADFLRSEIHARRERATDDVLSIVANSQIEGRPITEAEALGTSILLYIAGLDTVVNSLCWHFRHLAEHADDQAILRSNPAQINKAVEEFLRGYSIVTVTRVVTADVEFGGVTMRKDDVVAVPTALASRDPHEFEDAGTIEIDRSARRHLSFGFGPHICLGMHLARVEINVAIEEWLKRVPPFHIKEGATIPCHGGAVLTIERLPLAWDKA